MRKIEHLAKALVLADMDPMSISNDARATLAQVHATLALVEQQRIANVIALGEHWHSTGHDFIDSMAPVLRDDIQAALGLD